MSTAEVVSNSIRNGVIFVLVILIVHFAVKIMVERRDGSHSAHSERFSSSPSSSKARITAPPPMPFVGVSGGNNAELLNYVFGGNAVHPSYSLEASDSPAEPRSYSPPPPSAPPAIPKACEPSGAPPPLPMATTGLGSEQPSESGFVLVNKYQDESVMCGGTVYPDEPGIQGFDGTNIPFSW